VFTIDLDRALALFAEPKRAGRRQPAKRVIRQMDATDGGAALQVLEGRYGPYVSDGETNASIPKGMDPATLSLEDARGLIEARRGAPAKPGRRVRRASARKRSGPSRATGIPAETAAATAGKGRVKRKSAVRKTVH
jgi:DNA topoisomerase-1